MKITVSRIGGLLKRPRIKNKLKGSPKIGVARPLIFILLFISIFITWKWGDWRNWELYYSTILYMIFADLAYIILSFNKPLWQYESPIFSSHFVESLIAFVVFPCTCLVFLPLFSKVSKPKALVYILLWALLYSCVEYVSFRLGYFSYHYGWNLYWSFGFNCLMFPLLILHYKKPLWVWPPSIALAFLTIYLFDLRYAIFK